MILLRRLLCLIVIFLKEIESLYSFIWYFWEQIEIEINCDMKRLKYLHDFEKGIEAEVEKLYIECFNNKKGFAYNVFEENYPDILNVLSESPDFWCAEIEVENKTYALIAEGRLANKRKHYLIEVA